MVHGAYAIQQLDDIDSTFRSCFPFCMFRFGFGIIITIACSDLDFEFEKGTTYSCSLLADDMVVDICVLQSVIFTTDDPKFGIGLPHLVFLLCAKLC